MLPTFPDRKPLEPTDRAAIERVTRRFAPYSDFAFGSLWAWDVEGSCRIASLHGNLVVQLKDYGSDEHFFGFIGDRRVTETAGALLERAVVEGIAPELRLVPAAVVAADRRLPAALTVVPDPANDDYVCSIPAWVSLSGQEFAAHRAKINRCRSRSSLQERDLDVGDRETRRALL